MNPSWPRTPVLLGAAGLIPFVAGAVLLLSGVATVAHTDVRAALLSYGAVILSFLGGVRWGVALGLPASHEAALQYALSITPSLAAWVGLLLPKPWDAVALTLCFVVLGALDVQMTRHGLAPAWYGRLRIGLTIVAALCVASAVVPLRSG